MTAHPFQPFTALIGLAVIALGVVVATFGVGDVATSLPVWLAGGAAAVGLAVIPWRRRRPTAPQ